MTAERFPDPQRARRGRHPRRDHDPALTDAFEGSLGDDQLTPRWRARQHEEPRSTAAIAHPRAERDEIKPRGRSDLSRS